MLRFEGSDGSDYDYHQSPSPIVYSYPSWPWWEERGKQAMHNDRDSGVDVASQYSRQQRSSSRPWDQRTEELVRSSSRDGRIVHHPRRVHYSSPESRYRRLEAYSRSPSPSRSHGGQSPGSSPGSPDLDERGPDQGQTARSESAPRPPSRKIDGIFRAGLTKDVTVHLDLELQDDPTEELEEVRRLVRLGWFKTAKKYFATHLEKYEDHLYVLVEYADMLYRQGDFESLSKLVSQPLDGLADDQDSDEWALHLYWSMLKIYTKAFQDVVTVTPDDRLWVWTAAEMLKSRLGNADSALGLPEIRILAVLIRLGQSYRFSFTDMGMRDFVSWVRRSSAWKGHCESLLRHGRIWDFGDLFQGIYYAVENHELSEFLELLSPSDASATDRTGPQGATGALISAWTDSTPADNLSGTLALLDLFTYVLQDTSRGLIHQLPTSKIMEQTTQLARSVLLHHPQALKSRPYLDWMLLKAYHANEQGNKDFESYVNILDMFPGVYVDSLVLPAYVPRQEENPGWRVPDAKPEIRDAIRLVLRTARDIGDYQTESMALGDLIRVSSNPASEFEQLCALAKSNGDNATYARALTSKYLISTTPELRDKLKYELAAFLSKPDRLKPAGDYTAWMVNMLYVRLEGPNSPLSQGPFDHACRIYSDGNLPRDFKDSICAKFPSMRGKARSRPVHPIVHDVPGGENRGRERERVFDMDFEKKEYQANQEIASRAPSTDVSTSRNPIFRSSGTWRGQSNRGLDGGLPLAQRDPWEDLGQPYPIRQPKAIMPPPPPVEPRYAGDMREAAPSYKELHPADHDENDPPSDIMPRPHPEDTMHPAGVSEEFQLLMRDLTEKTRHTRTRGLDPEVAADPGSTRVRERETRTQTKPWPAVIQTGSQEPHNHGITGPAAAKSSRQPGPQVSEKHGGKATSQTIPYASAVVTGNHTSFAGGRTGGSQKMQTGPASTAGRVEGQRGEYGVPDEDVQGRMAALEALEMGNLPSTTENWGEAGPRRPSRRRSSSI